MRTKVTLILLFLNVALFFFIFKVERRWLHDDSLKIARENVLGPEAADIRALKITGGNPVHTLALAKRGEAWFVTAPLEWPANPAAVNRILTELQFLKHETSFKVSELANNGQSLADYGLDKPHLTIAISSGDPVEHPQPTLLRIGDMTKDGLRLYVLSPDGEIIHVVSQSLARSLGLTADDLRTDALFTIPVFEARSLNLQTAGPASLRIRLRRDGSRWSFETPIIARASKTATELAINGLNALRVASFITSNPPATLPSANPSFRITLEGNNRRETMILGAPVHPDAPAGRGFTEYYAQLEGRDALFTVKIPSGPGELMDNLRNAQVSLRETRILDFDAPAVTAVTLTAPNQPQLILQRLETGTQSPDSSAWQIVRRGETTVAPQTQPADRATVQRLLEELSRLSATDFKSDAPTAADLESWGFNRPEREAFITLGGGTAPLSVQFGTDAKHNVYARLGPIGPDASPGSSIYAVDAGILRELPVAPRAWRDRLLRELPPGARLTALKLTDLTNDRVLLSVTLDEAGRPPAGTKNAEAVATVLAQLRTLRAKEFILDQFADKVSVAGEERPWRYRLEATATLVGGAGEQTSVTTLFLTSRVGGGQQLAGSRATEYNAVFTIEQPLVDALWTITESPRDPGPLPPETPTPAPASTSTNPAGNPEAPPIPAPISAAALPAPPLPTNPVPVTPPATTETKK
ncbi:MAG: DUF4340 domain-containing protein [Opitutaceae bacterium]